ncbi:11895_t:CDS:2, partial [Dentiscutata heterogama]
SSGIKLDPTEERILKDQISVIERKESYFTLYRFATKLDWILMFIGLVFSAATGAAMPDMSLINGVILSLSGIYQSYRKTNSYIKLPISGIIPDNDK